MSYPKVLLSRVPSTGKSDVEHSRLIDAGNIVAQTAAVIGIALKFFQQKYIRDL